MNRSDFAGTHVTAFFEMEKDARIACARRAHRGVCGKWIIFRLAFAHYPALTPMFAKVSPALELLVSGDEMRASLHDEGPSRFELFTTGDRSASVRAARLAFGIEIDGGADAQTTSTSPHH